MRKEKKAREDRKPVSALENKVPIPANTGRTRGRTLQIADSSVAIKSLHSAERPKEAQKLHGGRREKD